MSLDLQALREAAEKATPGPWTWHTGCSWRRLSTLDGETDGDVLRPEVSSADGHPDCCVSYSDMAHIAAMDPTTTLALLDEVERLRKREASLYDLLNRCERDVQRAFRDAREQVGMGAVPFSGASACPYTKACKSIQQRAVGVEAPREASA